MPSRASAWKLGQHALVPSWQVTSLLGPPRKNLQPNLQRAPGLQAADPALWVCITSPRPRPCRVEPCLSLRGHFYSRVSRPAAWPPLHPTFLRTVH